MLDIEKVQVSTYIIKAEAKNRAECVRNIANKLFNDCVDTAFAAAREYDNSFYLRVFYRYLGIANQEMSISVGVIVYNGKAPPILLCSAKTEERHTYRVAEVLLDNRLSEDVLSVVNEVTRGL